MTWSRFHFGSAACWARIIANLRPLVRSRVTGRELVKAFREMEEQANV